MKRLLFSLLFIVLCFRIGSCGQPTLSFCSEQSKDDNDEARPYGAHMGRGCWMYVSIQRFKGDTSHFGLILLTKRKCNSYTQLTHIYIHIAHIYINN